MLLHRLRTLITASLIVFICFQNAYVFGSSASEFQGAYGSGESGLYIGYQSSINNSSAQNESAWSLTYSISSLIESDIDSAFHYFNPGPGGFKFGFGDTELSTEFNISGDSGHLPGVVVEATALVPVENSNQEAVSQIYELEYSIGLIKQLHFMSIQTNIGYITANDHISDEGFDHNLTYGLEIEFPLFLEKIICGTELKGDFADSNNEYPVLLKTGLIYQLNDRIAIDGGFEFGMNDPESANIIFGMNFSI